MEVCLLTDRGDISRNSVKNFKRYLLTVPSFLALPKYISNVAYMIC